MNRASHPLEPLVHAAFRGAETLDYLSLAHAICGPKFVHDDAKADTFNAVVDDMIRGGKLEVVYKDELALVAETPGAGLDQ